MYSNARTDEKLLEEFGFTKKSKFYWSGKLTQEKADRLRRKLQVRIPRSLLELVPCIPALTWDGIETNVN